MPGQGCRHDASKSLDSDTHPFAKQVSNKLMAEPAPEASPGIIIVGAGIAGICAAIQLRQAGHNVQVLEKGDAVGGTWRDNIYPGAACDIPSHLYSFSFAPKDDWSRTYATQDEILAYLEDSVRDFGIEDLIRYGAVVAATHYDEDLKVWTVELGDGETLSAEFLILACGQLHVPNIPEFPGLDKFDGDIMHSAEWHSDTELEDRNVALIGSAASGIQIATAIAETVNHLTIFQRSPNWIAPRAGGSYSAFQKHLFRIIPPLRKLRRHAQFLQHEMTILAFRTNSIAARLMTFVVRSFMRYKTKDRELLDALTPDYPIGCKRILLSNSYLKLFNRDDVLLEASGIAGFERNGILTNDGRRHPVDLAILATGFRTTEFLAPIDICGRDGKALSEVWAEGPQAHLGITVPGFPNMFLLYGPNTGLGHNSMVFMIECQVRYVQKLLDRMKNAGTKEVVVREAVSEMSNARLQKRAAETAWAGTCASWYKNEQGLLVGIWPYSATRYWWMTREPDLSEFDLR